MSEKTQTEIENSINIKTRDRTSKAYQGREIEKDYRQLVKYVQERKRQRIEEKAKQPSLDYLETKRNRNLKNLQKNPVRYAKLDKEKHYEIHLREKNKEIQFIELQLEKKKDKLQEYEIRELEKEIELKKTYIYYYKENCSNFDYRKAYAIIKAEQATKEDLVDMHREIIDGTTGKHSTTMLHFFRRTPQSHRKRIEYLYNTFYHDNILDISANVVVPDYQQMCQNDIDEIKERHRYNTRNPKNKFPIDNDYCKNCGSIDFYNDQTHGCYICSKCAHTFRGEVHYTPTYDHKLSLGKPSPGYDRVSHFVETIARLEGTEKLLVPAEVIEKVRKKYFELRIDPIEKPHLVTNSTTRELLKQIRYSKYLSNTTQIISRLTNIPSIRFSEEQKQNLIDMFNEIQKPFQKFKGRRTNFPSYSYTLYKLCQLLEYDDFLEKLKLLQHDKLRDLDIIWKKICEEVDYEYHETSI
jgi:ribosomal protein L37AE/L43A